MELIEAAAFYEGEVPGLGERFDVKWSGNRFPFALIYSVSSDALRIVVVANQNRRPGYWRSRVDRNP